MINTTNIINLSEVRFYYFKIYEKNIDEPLIYIFEIYEKRGLPNYDIILNHYIYKNTEDLISYIIDSESYDYPYIEYIFNENLIGIHLTNYGLILMFLIFILLNVLFHFFMIMVMEKNYH